MIQRRSWHPRCRREPAVLGGYPLLFRFSDLHNFGNDTIQKRFEAFKVTVPLQGAFVHVKATVDFDLNGMLLTCRTPVVLCDESPGKGHVARNAQARARKGSLDPFDDGPLRG